MTDPSGKVHQLFQNYLKKTNESSRNFIFILFQCYASGQILFRVVDEKQAQLEFIEDLRWGRVEWLDHWDGTLKPGQKVVVQAGTMPVLAMMDVVKELTISSGMKWEDYLDSAIKQLQTEIAEKGKK